jgi:hypothetical protein
LGLLGIAVIGVVPLVVVRSSAETDDVLVPLIGSFALGDMYCRGVLADRVGDFRPGRDGALPHGTTRDVELGDVPVSTRSRESRTTPSG